MAKKKGRDSNNSDGFIGLLILLAIIGLVIRFFNQIMIGVAVLAAVLICMKLYQFFRENTEESVMNEAKTEKTPGDHKPEE